MPEKDPPVSQPPAASDCAIDDSDDGDESYVEAQRIRSEQKQKRPQTDSLRVQEIFPVHFSPLVQPLTSSSVESCVVLENAAFPNPDRRATREKVSQLFFSFPLGQHGVSPIAPLSLARPGWMVIIAACSALGRQFALLRCSLVWPAVLNMVSSARFGSC